MANAALLLDYLFLQSAIEVRLRALLPQVEVLGAEEIAQVIDATVRTDTLFVLWDGERFPDDAQDGKAVLVRQRWIVFYAAPNASQHDGAARNRGAGLMLSALHKALAGWSPEGALRPFRRTNGPRPNYRANVGLYPLSFEIAMTL